GDRRSTCDGGGSGGDHCVHSFRRSSASKDSRQLCQAPRGKTAGRRAANDDAAEAQHGRRYSGDLCFVRAVDAAELVLSSAAKEPGQLVRKGLQLLSDLPCGRSILRIDLSVVDYLLHI